jgi:Uma2 family endonuclease
MTRALERPRKTVADLMALPDDVRGELIEGEIYLTPSGTPSHQETLLLVAAKILSWATAGRRGRTFVEVDVHLPSGDVVRPDVTFVVAERGHVVADRVRGVPDLVVEVVSSSQPLGDRVVKRDLYARNGVPEYWIVEPDDEAIQVLRLGAGGYVAAGYFRRGSALVSATLPDLAMDVSAVFPRPEC